MSDMDTPGIPNVLHSCKPRKEEMSEDQVSFMKHSTPLYNVGSDIDGEYL